MPCPKRLDGCGIMELMAGVWEFVNVLSATSRGWFWLVLGVVTFSLIGTVLQELTG